MDRLTRDGGRTRCALASPICTRDREGHGCEFPYGSAYVTFEGAAAFCLASRVRADLRRSRSPKDQRGLGDSPGHGKQELVCPGE